MKAIRKMADRLVTLAGITLISAMLVNFVMGYGNRWKPGRYCMPRTIVAPDGKHYANSDVIDPFTRVLIANDQEEEFFACVLTFFFVSFVYFAIQMVLHVRKAKRIFTMKFRIAMGCGDQCKFCNSPGQRAKRPTWCSLSK